MKCVGVCCLHCIHPVNRSDARYIVIKIEMAHMLNARTQQIESIIISVFPQSEIRTILSWFLISFHSNLCPLFHLVYYNRKSIESEALKTASEDYRGVSHCVVFGIDHIFDRS